MLTILSLKPACRARLYSPPFLLMHYIGGLKAAFYV